MAKLELSQQKLNSVKKAEEYYNALRTNIQLSGNNLKVIAVKENLQLLQISLGLLRVQGTKHY